MLSLALSSLAFLFAWFFIRRYLESMGMPKGATRNVVVVVFASLISYAVAFIVGRFGA